MTDDRAWAAATAGVVVAQAREEAVAEVRERLRARMVEALLHAIDQDEPPPSGTGVWLYGVTDGDAPEPARLSGVDGEHEVRAVRSAGLCALVSDVPLAQFGSEILERRLEDLAVVEALARAHEAVLDVALEHGTVVPARLCTLYASDESVAAMLEHDRPGLARTLERLRGAREWGVKAFVATREEQRVAAVSGADYLASRQRSREKAEEAFERAASLAERIHAALGEQAAGAVVGRPHERSLAGRDDTMILNASYLVPDARLDDFAELVSGLAERHREAGVDVVLTGPWPPYHFIEDA